MSSNNPSDDISSAEDEASWAAYEQWLNEQEHRYEESVRASYAARGQANLY